MQFMAGKRKRSSETADAHNSIVEVIHIPDQDTHQGSRLSHHRRSNSSSCGSGGNRAVDRVVSEEEVDEFYAILRRMHEASRSLKNCSSNNSKNNGNSDLDEQKAAALRWRPAFAWEDFFVSTTTNNKKKSNSNSSNIIANEKNEKEKEERATLLSLDLNVEPEPETETERRRVARRCAHAPA